jgi:hypothetical protein
LLLRINVGEPLNEGIAVEVKIRMTELIYDLILTNVRPQDGLQGFLRKIRSQGFSGYLKMILTFQLRLHKKIIT